MKKFSGIIVFILLVSAFQNGMMAEDTRLRVTVNVNAYDRQVTVSINDVTIKKITGGQAQAIQLYHEKHPLRKDAPKEYIHNFCLKEGKNTIRITHQKTMDDSPSSLEVSIQAIGYDIPLLKYTQKGEIASGETAGVFELYSKQPEGFQTVVLE